MSRPEFPIGTALPSSMISRIREEQEWYDRDPERAEREYRRREEARQEELELEREEQRHDRERE